jgi:3-dehydroquinate dehydratase/shikimate dehydrogenase
MLQALFSMNWEEFSGMGLFGNETHRICGVAAASTAREMGDLVRQARRLTRTVELRLDWLKDDTEREKFLGWLKRTRLGRAVFLATCRRRIGGGEFAGDAGAELFWLMKAREAGCQWCDLEIETLRALPGASVRGYAVPEKVLLSIHDFRRTPRLPKKVAVPMSGGVDAVKIAAMARTLADSLRLLKWVRESRRAVAVPMGEIGMPARILALREGSALAYAPVAAATAPGQVCLRELKELYRAHELTHQTRIYGVIGNPVGHSLSPLLHNTGYIASRIDAVFLPFLVERLADFLKAVPDFGVKGFSVTLPHKESVFRWLDECEPLAEKIGAVNTVTVRRDGSLYGSNTDYLGVLRAVEKKMRLSGSRVLIFGAGGAARAAAFAVAKAGAQVFVCARREKAARTLARAVTGEVVARSALRKLTFDAILNATPVGMHPREGISPLAASELNCSLVMDLIYWPMQTKLLRIASEQGIKTVSGVNMFLAQGIAQWEHWMGSRAPEALMRRAVLKELKAKEKLRR